MQCFIRWCSRMSKFMLKEEINCLLQIQMKRRKIIIMLKRNAKRSKTKNATFNWSRSENLILCRMMLCAQPTFFCETSWWWTTRKLVGMGHNALCRFYWSWGSRLRHRSLMEKNVELNPNDKNLSEVHFENFFPCTKLHAKLINEDHFSIRSPHHNTFKKKK